jgi:hypothetical protein
MNLIKYFYLFIQLLYLLNKNLNSQTTDGMNIDTERPHPRVTYENIDAAIKFFKDLFPNYIEQTITLDYVQKNIENKNKPPIVVTPKAPSVGQDNLESLRICGYEVLNNTERKYVCTMYPYSYSP